MAMKNVEIIIVEEEDNKNDDVEHENVETDDLVSKEAYPADLNENQAPSKD